MPQLANLFIHKEKVPFVHFSPSVCAILEVSKIFKCVDLTKQVPFSIELGLFHATMITQSLVSLNHYPLIQLPSADHPKEDGGNSSHSGHFQIHFAARIHFGLDFLNSLSNGNWVPDYY